MSVHGAASLATVSARRGSTKVCASALTVVAQQVDRRVSVSFLRLLGHCWRSSLHQDVLFGQKACQLCCWRREQVLLLSACLAGRLADTQTHTSGPSIL
jgi:hypothetical protein